MNIEKQCCSLDLAKRLKELGVKQDSLFVWEERHGSWFVENRGNIYSNTDKCSAFTVAELGEMLPEIIDRQGVTGQDKYVLVMGRPLDWHVSYRNEKLPTLLQRADTEADARAKMLIYLIEKGLLDLI